MVHRLSCRFLHFVSTRRRMRARGLQQPPCRRLRVLRGEFCGLCVSVVHPDVALTCPLSTWRGQIDVTDIYRLRQRGFG